MSVQSMTPTLAEQIVYQQRQLENCNPNHFVALVAKSIKESLEELAAARERVKELEKGLGWMRDEYMKYPRSLAYQITHIPKIDALLRQRKGGE